MPAFLVTLIKLIGGPGSIGLLVVVSAITLTVRHWSKRALPWRVATVAFCLVAVVYVVLALPITANALISRLPAAPPIGDADLRKIRTLFILDGDNREGRARQAALVAKRAQLAEVWLLGWDYMLDDLAMAGFPPGVLQQDASAGNTREQVVQVHAIISGRQRSAAIVASRLSIPRIATFTKAIGLEVLLVPAPLDSELARGGVWLIIPSYGALKASRDAIYEHGALLYYQKLEAP